MAVALATLPLKSLLVGDGEWLFVAAAGSGWAMGFAEALRTGVAGLEALLVTAFAADWATGFFTRPALTAAFLATGLPVDKSLAAPLPTTAFFTDPVFTGAFLTGAFLTDAFFTGAFFAGACFAAAFFAGADFFVGALAGAFRAAVLGAAFFTAVLTAGFAVVLVEDLLALFTIRSLLAAAFNLPTLAVALAGVLPLCALAAVELAFVFAISLHHSWPWRPGVIADVFHIGKSVSGIVVPLHATNRTGEVKILTRLILWLLRLYKRWLSPLLGSRCRFHPSCSDYARIAVTRFGPGRGSLLAAWRLLRCQPMCDGGEEPVPEHFHFPRCHHQKESRDSG